MQTSVTHGHEVVYYVSLVACRPQWSPRNRPWWPPSLGLRQPCLRQRAPRLRHPGRSPIATTSPTRGCTATHTRPTTSSRCVAGQLPMVTLHISSCKKCTTSHIGFIAAHSRLPACCVRSSTFSASCQSGPKRGRLPPSSWSGLPARTSQTGQTSASSCATASNSPMQRGDCRHFCTLCTNRR